MYRRIHAISAAETGTSQANETDMQLTLHRLLPTDREHRRFAVFLALSVLVHAIILFGVRHQPLPFELPAGEKANEPIAVRLQRAPPPPAPAKPSTPVPPVAQAVPEKPVTPRPPQARIKPLPRPTVKPSAKPTPIPAAPEAETPPAPVEQARTPPAADMSEMIAAARRRREASQQAGNGSSDAPQPAEPGKNDVALANINRDLQRASRKPSLTSGVFQIMSKGVRTAQVQFRGWAPGSDTAWRQTLDVDAGLSGDVDRAIVRRIIALIRTHYTGDFNWESDRLGRVVPLSARQKDNDELEAFLMREFFGG
jgi:outer membrane biosynthesis protein TonB